MYTFKEFLEQRDAELYNEMNWRDIVLGGALLGSTLGLGGGKAYSQNFPDVKNSSKSTVIQKQTKVMPSSEESIANFEAIKSSVKNYGKQTLEKISTDSGKKFLSDKNGHWEIDGATIHNQLSNYNLHVYLVKGSTDSKVPQLRFANMEANFTYVNSKINNDTSKQPLLLIPNKDATIFFAVTEK